MTIRVRIRADEDSADEVERIVRQLEDAGVAVLLERDRTAHTAAACKDEQETETARLASEWCYRAIFEQSPFGIVVVEPETLLPVEFNAAAHQQLGYSREEFARLCIADYEAIESFEEIQAHGSKILEAGWGEFETLHRTKQGELRNVRVIVQRIQIGARQLAHIIYQDITEKKLAETHLQYQSTLLANVLDAIIATDMDFNILSWNPAAERMYGWTATEVIGRQLREFIHFEFTQSSADDVLQQILEQGAWRGEVTQNRKDGSNFPALIASSLVKDLSGAPVGLAAITRDITDLKQAESALAIGAAKFRALFINNHAVMLLVDPQTGALIDVNPAACAFYGWSWEELTAKHISDINTLGMDVLRVEMQKAANELGKYFVFQHRLASGEIRDVEIYCGPIEHNGRILLYSIIHDITARRMAEEALYQKIEESRGKTRQLETITELSASMRQAQTRSAMVQALLLKLKTLINAHFASVAFLEAGTLVFENGVGLSGEWREQRINLQGSVLGQVIERGKPASFTIMDEEPAAELPGFVRADLPATGALAVYPLAGGQRTVGVLIVGFDQASQLSAEQGNLMAAAADMAGNAIKRMLAAEEMEHMIERREKELEYIYQVTSSPGKALDITESLRQALALTLPVVHGRLGGIFLVNENDDQPVMVVSHSVVSYSNDSQSGQLLDLPSTRQKVATVLRTSKPVVEPDWDDDPMDDFAPDLSTTRSFVGLPMTVQNRAIGALVIQKRRGKQVNVQELTLLSFVADHLAMVVENHRLYQVAQQSAVLEERSRLARELHDSVTQSLYSANMYTAGAQRFATQGKFAEVEAYLHEIGQLTQQALKDLRLMIYELRSAEVAQHGLMAALENRLDAVERRSGIAAEIVVADSVVLPGVVEENLYRTAIEALNNALKYAQARQVRLEFKQVEDDLIFSISDTGAGFDVEAGLANGGVGLASMRERAETLGGQFEVTSCPGNGTRVEVRIPLGRGAGQGVRGDD